MRTIIRVLLGVLLNGLAPATRVGSHVPRSLGRNRRQVATNKGVLRDL
jgi:hypothetical protein